MKNRYYMEVKDSGLLPNMDVFKGVEPDTYELKGGDVIYLTGEKGMGKTQLMAHLAGTQMLPPVSFEKVEEARKEAAILRAKGYKKAFIPAEIKHLVYSPEDEIIRTCKDQGYLPRETHVVDIERLRLPDGEPEKAQFLPYGATITIDELMKRFDCQNFNSKEKGLPPALAAFLQYCRHYGICVITGAILASATDLRFRQMSSHIHAIIRREDYFKDDKLVKVVWYTLEFTSSKICDKFLDSHEPIYGTPHIFTHNGNMRACVDSFAKKPAFTEGFEDREIEFPTRRSA